MRPNVDFDGIAIQGRLVSLLLEYSTPWLCLGLETVFHTTIEPQTEPLKLELKEFIVSRLRSILIGNISEKQN
jgi:hypothetical protein